MAQALGGQGQGMGLTEHGPQVVVLFRDEGQVRRFGYGLELSRPRSLSGPQALRQAMGTPRQDASCSPIDLRVVSNNFVGILGTHLI